MTLRACSQGSHHKLQGPARDNEYQLVMVSFNIEQPGILVEDGNVGFSKRKKGVKTRRHRYGEDRELRIASW